MLASVTVSWKARRIHLTSLDALMNLVYEHMENLSCFTFIMVKLVYETSAIWGFQLRRCALACWHGCHQAHLHHFGGAIYFWEGQQKIYTIPQESWVGWEESWHHFLHREKTKFLCKVGWLRCQEGLFNNPTFCNANTRCAGWRRACK